MNILHTLAQLAPDNAGRRSGTDRRVFSYALHIPERRRGAERRSGSDRRRQKDSLQMTAPRGIERRLAFAH